MRLRCREQPRVLSLHTPGLGSPQQQSLALEQQHGLVEAQPCAWETPLAWALALARVRKAVVGAKVSQIKPWTTVLTQCLLMNLGLSWQNFCNLWVTSANKNLLLSVAIGAPVCRF
ncbi:hypothetical protein TURU_056351 [Turdus rufiventris]|nr:hypothetical protein TURU_056351 [Turdus rufiventris]